MADIHNDEPPVVAGSQPVHQKPDPVPGTGRTVLQTVVLVLAALALFVGIAWIAVPLFSG